MLEVDTDAPNKVLNQAGNWNKTIQGIIPDGSMMKMKYGLTVIQAQTNTIKPAKKK
jgi:hypothetical protein